MAEHQYVRSVERRIPAAPEAIFALLADPSRHPEIDGSTTVRSVRSAGHLAPGSTFDMNMQHGYRYSTRNTIVDLEPNRVIAWQTRPLTFPLPLLVGGRVWRYELEPSERDTLVRETWDIRPERNRRLVSRLGEGTERSMSETLERIERLVTG